MGSTTLASVLSEIQYFKHQIAISSALSSYLRSRYLPRDSQGTPAKINCDGAPVPEEAILEAVAQIEADVEEMKKSLEKLLDTEVGS